MQRSAQLVSEIQSIGSEPNIKNATKLLRLLEGNAALFSNLIGEETFSPLLKRFKHFGDCSSAELSNKFEREDYQRSFDLLLFYLNRI